MKPTPTQKLIAVAALAAVGLAGCESGSTRADLVYHYPPSSVYPAPYMQQTYPQVTYSPPTYGPPAPSTLTNPGALAPYQIDQLTAPIALYPDPLLAIVLPASTYPNDVATAATWLQSNPNPTDDAINAQPWDQSVKALVKYPNILQQLASNMDWTQALGVAFLNQQQDVMDSIQRMRAQAQTQGNLYTNPDQSVVVDQGAICIVPVSPNYLYVPVYDPYYAYYYPCNIGYFACSFGFFFNDFCCDWHHHCVNRGFDWQHHFHDGHFNGNHNAFATGHTWTRDASRAAPVMPQRFVNSSGRPDFRTNPLFGRTPDWQHQNTQAFGNTPNHAFQSPQFQTPQHATAPIFQPQPRVQTPQSVAPSHNFQWAPAPTFRSAPAPVMHEPAPTFRSEPSFRSEPAPTFRSEPAPQMSAPAPSHDIGGGGSRGGGGFSGPSPSWGGSMGGGGGGGGGHR